MKRVTVYCGSNKGNGKVFEQQAYELGCILAKNGLELVYGGAKVGLMGIVANGVLDSKGKVTGVLPTFLKEREVAHEKLTELILVNTMHERKLKMFELSDGIIALPGGYGTLEELFEMLTWSQLGLHNKPIGILNVNGFYNELIALLSKMTKKGFLKETNRQMLLVSDNINNLLKQMNQFKAPEIKRLIDKEMI